MKKIILGSLVLISVIGCEKKLSTDLAEVPANFVGLKVPPKDSGYQMHVAPFPVPANFEREWYLRQTIGNKEKIYVTSIEVKMRPGTHHMIAYPFSNELSTSNPPVGVMRDQNMFTGRINLTSNNAMAGFIIESTAPEYKLDFPGGYAIPFEADATLDLNSHYFNKTKKTLYGEVFMNLYTKPKNQITGELVDLSIFNTEKLILPPNKETVIDFTEIFTEEKRFIMLTSHTHRRGQNFKIYGVGGLNDGKLLYESSDYVHPVITYYSKPLVIEKGAGLKSVVTYNNAGNTTIEFGVTSEDEMGVIFGYFIKN